MNDDRLSELLRSEVPAPGPGYWESIDATLADVGAVTDAASPEDSLPNALSPNALSPEVERSADGPVDLIDPGPIDVAVRRQWHRGGGRSLVALAAAVLVAAAAGIGLLRIVDDGTAIDVAGEPAEQSTEPATVDESGATDGSDGPNPNDGAIVIAPPDDAQSSTADRLDRAANGTGSPESESPESESTGTESPASESTEPEDVGPSGTDPDPASDEEQNVPPAPEPTVYEGFDLGLVDGVDAIGAAGTGVGFIDGSTWSIIAGSATVTFDEVGLGYRDAAGRDLATADGAVSIRPVAVSPELVRELASPLVTANGYWVGYLLRLDSDVAGDAFWTTDGSWDRGSAGLQSRPVLQVVNGARSTVVHERGATHFIVIRVTATGAEIWIDPELDPEVNAAGEVPGPPDLTDDRITLDGELARFKFNTANEGAYTIDEFRIGHTFAQVAPAQGPAVPTADPAP